MSGFTPKDIRTIVLKSVHPSLFDFHFPFAWYFLKELHSLCVRKVSKIMKGIFTGFKSFYPVIFNKLKKEKYQTHYNGTLYSLALVQMLYRNTDKNMDTRALCWFSVSGFSCLLFLMFIIFQFLFCIVSIICSMFVLSSILYPFCCLSVNHLFLQGID